MYIPNYYQSLYTKSSKALVLDASGPGKRFYLIPSKLWSKGKIALAAASS